MANRVELSANGLKVSKPGFDVLATTNPYNLLIDSNKIYGVHSTGVVDVPAGSTVNIPFGITFSAFPLVYIQGCNAVDVAGFGYQGFSPSGGAINMPLTITWTTSVLTIISNSAFAPYTKFRYVVFYQEA